MKAMKPSTMTMKLTSITTLLSLGAALAMLASGCVTNPGPVLTPTDEASMNSAATVALKNLYANNPAAKALGSKARAILIFPDVLKGGFMIGAQLGNGVLRQNGHTAGYYNLVAASYGWQVGLQQFGYALFLMNDSAMAYLNNTGGWEVGVGPSVVVMDEGMSRNMTTTTMQKDVYAFVFNQTGLMAGAGLQGSKITRIGP
jgi:lipid-binding SYLF domain-containing protein